MRTSLRCAPVSLIVSLIVGLSAALAALPLWGAKPAFVDITWMSIANIYYEIGGTGILTDGYFSRIPQDQFYGGGGGLAHTRMAFKPNVETIRRVLDALGGKAKINLLLTGHSHFD